MQFYLVSKSILDDLKRPLCTHFQNPFIYHSLCENQGWKQKPRFLKKFLLFLDFSVQIPDTKL